MDMHFSVSICPQSARRGYLITWSWSYWQLGATMQVLGTEPGSLQEQCMFLITDPILQRYN